MAPLSSRTPLVPAHPVADCAGTRSARSLCRVHAHPGPWLGSTARRESGRSAHLRRRSQHLAQPSVVQGRLAGACRRSDELLTWAAGRTSLISSTPICASTTSESWSGTTSHHVLPAARVLVRKSDPDSADFAVDCRTGARAPEQARGRHSRSGPTSRGSSKSTGTPGAWSSSATSPSTTAAGC